MNRGFTASFIFVASALGTWIWPTILKMWVKCSRRNALIYLRWMVTNCLQET